MLGTGWLPLNDYSTKYQISISTLRRRIRSGTIENQFRDGKYWIKDQPTHRSYQTERSDLASVKTVPHAPSSTPIANTSAPVSADNGETSALEMANHLVAELKSAYVLILQEKEEQILQLKEEVADLKTLVRILEADREKTKSPDLNEAPGEWLNDILEP